MTVGIVVAVVTLRTVTVVLVDSWQSVVNESTISQYNIVSELQKDGNAGRAAPKKIYLLNRIFILNSTKSSPGHLIWRYILVRLLLQNSPQTLSHRQKLSNLFFGRSEVHNLVWGLLLHLTC